MTPEDPIAGRLYLLLPPLVLIAMLVAGFSATYAAVIGTASCVVVAYFRRRSWLNLAGWAEVLRNGARQAAEIAVPIAAIGIIIAVAIQSNLALKFSSGLIGASGGKLFFAMFLIIIGCLIMGMGLPTVAAYIIGAILFAPALKDLGIAELPAHFFVMYYCVLSMVTPPVALASFTAAGISGAGSMETGLIAFRLSLVSFLIPFAFAFDPRLLGAGRSGLGHRGVRFAFLRNGRMGGRAQRIPQGPLAPARTRALRLRRRGRHSVSHRRGRLGRRVHGTARSGGVGAVAGSSYTRRRMRESMNMKTSLYGGSSR